MSGREREKEREREREKVCVCEKDHGNRSGCLPYHPSMGLRLSNCYIIGATHRWLMTV